MTYIVKHINKMPIRKVYNILKDNFYLLRILFLVIVFFLNLNIEK